MILKLSSYKSMLYKNLWKSSFNTLVYKCERVSCVKNVTNSILQKNITSNTIKQYLYFDKSRSKISFYYNDNKNMDYISVTNRYKPIIKFLKQENIQNVFSGYVKDSFERLIEKERYYYKTRPSMVGKIIWGLMRSKSTFTLLTKFYFGSLRRRDLINKTGYSKEDGFMIYLLNEVNRDIGVENKADKSLNGIYDEEPYKKDVYKNYPVINTYNLTEEQMKSVVKSVYTEIEKKIKREQVKKGRWV